MIARIPFMAELIAANPRQGKQTVTFGPGTIFSKEEVVHCQKSQPSNNEGEEHICIVHKHHPSIFNQ
jgi:hypothetical protein